MIIKIKPLSVNQAWMGRKFKTPKYKAYEKTVLLMLKPLKIPPSPLKLVITFGFSNAQSDWDNPIKPFQDILQKKYGFNDCDIYEATVKKVIVKKGFEFIDFEIYSIKET